MKSKKIIVNDKMQKNYHPEFKPELTPKQMLKLGVFGGKYMTDCKKEFPKDWFEKALLCSERHDPDLNFFKINASQPLSVWREKGWMHEDDPRGWFQWFCRYYVGRRHLDDERQVKRWKAIQRHVGAVKKHCLKGDLLCRRKQRQAILHWAIDSRKI